MTKVAKKQIDFQAETFSIVLRRWLDGKQPKTLQSLIEAFAEKSFAIIFLLLMALPALPIPTGGITHITEIITMLICLELIIGRRTIWLPKRWLKTDVGKHLNGKAITRLLKIITWFERFSRRRLDSLLAHRVSLMVLGVVVLLFTVAAFAAPPFSGLDTLPSMGVVALALGLILDDAVIVVIGIALGALGIGLEVTAGTALYDGFKHFL